ncbi:hypothetical protein T4D_11631 [Trichinella pseudospiralis]|uniref:Uncharacterized protein n=1 Tax=Trichinella pseudospiralis TaxID=6337 RepID=A0A0V1F5E2_TRIPS|nr:hypothetical protein T4D_11631 [Trichinella pseudospiralis]
MSALLSGRVASDVATLLFGRDDDVVYSVGVIDRPDLRRLSRSNTNLKPVVRTILCDRAHNQDRQTLHLYSFRSSSSCVKLMIRMPNEPLNSSKSNKDPAIEQRSATFAGTDKSPSESSSAVLTRDLLSASVSVFSSPGQMIRVVSHPEELFHADLFIPKLRYSSANMSRLKNARKPLTAVGEENRRTAFNRSESVQNRTAMILQQPNLTVDTANLILGLNDLDGFVQRQDVTFLKKTSPYIVVVDAKDNLTQQPNSFTITAAV